MIWKCQKCGRFLPKFDLRDKSIRFVCRCSCNTYPADLLGTAFLKKTAPFWGNNSTETMPAFVYDGVLYNVCGFGTYTKFPRKVKIVK